MGTKVQIENYLPAHYPMKDLNHESSNGSWPSCVGESSLFNGQFFCGYLPRTVADSQVGYNKDLVKQTMLEHEGIFKNQLYELHRLYRVQRDLMDEVMRKVQYKRRIICETSSSSSPVPSRMQYDDVQRWNGPNLPMTNSACSRPHLSVPETVQSSPISAKGKSIQAGPSSFPKCYSPKNSQSESRPTKLRRQMIDLQLPADEYIDTDEVVQFNDVKDLDYTIPSPTKNRKSAAMNEKLFLVKGDDASRSDLHVSRPNTMADLNEPLLGDEATSVASVDFLHHGGSSQCDSQYSNFCARYVDTTKDVPQNFGKGTVNGTSNNSHFEHRTNGANWLGYALDTEDKGGARSINQGICLEKIHQPPAFLTGDHIKGDQWKARSVSNIQKSDRYGYSPSNDNVPGSVTSHVSNQHGFFHSSEFGKSWDQCPSPWGKSGSFLGQKPISVQTSPYHTSATVSKSPQPSAQSNDIFGNYNWNIHHSPSVLGNQTPVRNGFYEGSSSAFKGFDYVNSNCSEKKGATNCIELDSMKDVNLNVALPNDFGIGNVGLQGVKREEKDNKLEDSLAVLPWLNRKTISNEVENSRKDLNSIESALSRWGSSVVSNSCQPDVKAKIPDSSRKILGVPIFEIPATPKKEVSKPLITHCCSGNNEKENGRKKVGFDINVPCDLMEEEEVILEEKEQTESASLRHHFDLNSCVIDEDIPCETTFSISEIKTSVRVDTGIDLEAPVILEDEETVVISLDENSSIKDPEERQVLPQHNTDDEESDLARSAASAIVAISSYVNVSNYEEATCLDVETDDHLQWFVEIACSNNSDDAANGNNSLFKNLDDFEMMILRQKECNEEEYFPKSSFPEVPNAEEMGKCALTTTRTRKGNGRRGRQRRDFQRDILPGLTSLSRNEVTEDLQIFGGLMRATGHPWHSAPNRKNATRSRRRSVGTTSTAVSPDPTPVAASCAVKQQNIQNNNTKVGVDDRSLTGWGKTTRRPRRQRCPAGNPPAFVPLT